MRPTVYIETTIIGHLTSRLPNSVVVVGQMLETREWWEERRFDFDIFVSEFVRQEVSKGDPEAAAERLTVIDGISECPVPESALQLAADLVGRNGLPAKAWVDALHLSVCATNNIAYLLTWNCRHLANATRQKIIAEICSNAGYNVPIICTPAQL